MAAHKRNPPLCLQRAATSASCRPPGNRLSSVSLENCSPYFYHITSFLSHLPLPPVLVATTTATTTITTTTIIITSASLVFLLLFQLDALVDPFSHLHRTLSSFASPSPLPHFDPFPSSSPRPVDIHRASGRSPELAHRSQRYSTLPRHFARVSYPLPHSSGHDVPSKLLVAYPSDRRR